jgi:hypothetical protein
MQREATTDPFSTCLDQRHNPIIGCGLRSEHVQYKRGTRPHVLDRENLTLTFSSPIEERLHQSEYVTPPPTVSYPKVVPGQCQYRHQGRTDLLRR